MAFISSVSSLLAFTPWNALKLSDLFHQSWFSICCQLMDLENPFSLTIPDFQKHYCALSKEVKKLSFEMQSWSVRPLILVPTLFFSRAKGLLTLQENYFNVSKNCSLRIWIKYWQQLVIYFENRKIQKIQITTLRTLCLYNKQCIN